MISPLPEPVPRAGLRPALRPGWPAVTSACPAGPGVVVGRTGRSRSS